MNRIVILTHAGRSASEFKQERGVAQVRLPRENPHKRLASRADLSQINSADVRDTFRVPELTS